MYIFELNIRDINSRLSGTGIFGVIRVEHASGSSFVGLFLLLGSQVDGPPYRLMHGDILVDDVLDDAIS